MRRDKSFDVDAIPTGNVVDGTADDYPNFTE